MIEMSGIRRIVIRIPNWIGDTVMALQAVNCVKKAYPDVHISLLGKPSVNELHRYNTGVDRVIDLKLVQSGNKLAGIKKFSRGLKEYDFDFGLVLPDSFSSALIFKMGGVRIRAGYRSELRSFMLTVPVKPPSEAIHRSERYLYLVRETLGIENPDPDIRIPVSDNESRMADAFLDGVSGFAVVCPTSRAPSRRWGARKYADLMRRLSGDLGLDIVLAGSGDEAAAVEEVGRLAGIRCLNLSAKNNLLLSVEVMRRSSVFVGNDSGAAHLAAASGTRVVSISGADDPIETHPLAKVGTVVRKPLHCSPCVKNVCPRDDHPDECMDIVSVDDVFEAVTDILEREC